MYVEVLQHNSENDKNKNKLVHQTFRIEEDVIKALEKEAGNTGVSLSNLVNKTLKNHITSEMRFGKAGFIISTKDFFRKMFSELDERLIEQYGKDLGLIVTNEYVSYFFPDINSLTLVLFLNTWFDKFQSHQYRIYDSNRRHSFSVNHDINLNFSRVLQAILEGLIEPVIKRGIRVGELTSTTVTFSFEV